MRIHVRTITTALPTEKRHHLKKVVSVFALSVLSFTVQGSALPTKHWGVTVDTNTTLQKFELLAGAPATYQGAFVHLGNENAFPTELAAPLAQSGKTLVIFWEAMDYNREPDDQPEFSDDAINSGQWDQKIRDLAMHMRAYAGPVIFVPFSEMNGDWTPTGQGLYTNTPDKYIMAYRKVWNIFHEPSVRNPNVKFGWVVNNEPADAIPNYFPGKDVVDYVGLDGFNWGDPWQSYPEAFGPALQELKQLGRPILITSFASAAGSKKAAWMNDAFLHLQTDPYIVGWIWFNFKKEQDWRIESDRASVEAFKKAVQYTR